jgi:hypothetical protein
MTGENPKLQTPSSREIPSTKHQAPNTKEAPGSKSQPTLITNIWSLVFGASLELGAWSLELQ